MTRSYSRSACSMWEEDDDFMALSAGAQSMYNRLCGQRDVSACGSLPLTIKRWALRIREQDRAEVPTWIEELAAHRFVVVDVDTEELLIRTFVKWDGGYTNSKRLLAIQGASKGLRSPILRRALAAELVKLGIQPTFAVPEDVSADEYPIEGASHRLPDPASDSSRVVVTNVSTSTTTLNPETGNLNPGATPAGKPAPLPNSKTPRAHRLPDDWQPDPVLREWVQAECPHIDPRVETDNFCDFWHAKGGKDATKVSWELTYRKWMREQEQRALRYAKPSTPTRSTTDDRVAATLALRGKFGTSQPTTGQQRLEIA
jgi:hypothetical protein